MKLSGWGRHPVADCELARLREREDIPALLGRSGTLIARGNGRSYGDAALNPNLTVSTLAMDRMEAFDPKTGLLTCEAGVLLADILDTFVSRGWFPSVVPGTKFVTVGGMIAADVHGKNHHRESSFGAHVESLTLATADGHLHECSRTQRPDLFRATIGGMGLTGIVVSASFRLRRIETSYLSAETVASSNLEQTMALFETSAHWQHTVAWLDTLAQGTQRGRSLLTRGDFMPRASLPARLAQEPLRPAPKARLKVPFDAPSALLNRASIRAGNAFLYHGGRLRAGPRATHFDGFFFPLDGIGAWNRLVGRRGFVQYQCVLPKAESAAGIALLLERVAKARQASFLAVLKLLGSDAEGTMSFPMEGYTLTLDFPMRKGVLALMAELDEITHRHGGRIYLAKDACSAKERLQQGYPQSETFRRCRATEANASPKFASALSTRLAL